MIINKLRLPTFIIAIVLSFSSVAFADASGSEQAEEMGKKEVDAARDQVIKDLQEGAKSGDFSKYAKSYKKLKEERKKAEEEEKEKEEKK